MRSLIRALRFSSGRVEDIAPMAIDLAAEGVTWVDLQRSTDEEEKILSDVFRFHPLAIEDCIQDIHHPKVDDYGDYLYLVVHGARYEGSGKLSTAELDVFLGKGYLVTYHHDEMRSISEIWEKASRGAPHLCRGPDILLHAILDAQIGHYFPVIERIEDLAERLGAQVFGRPTPRTLEGILAVKRDLLHLKRIAAPQRDVFARISRGETAVVAQPHLMYFRDLYDHLFRMTEIADGLRDVLQGLQDGYLSAVGNRMNEIMKALTLVSTILLPMSVVGGIYGMNFDRMPELHWAWGYPFALLLMGLSAGGLVAWYKLKGWI